MSETRYSVQERIWIIKYKYLLTYPVSIKREWQKHYTSKPPTSQTINNIFNKWELSESVANAEKPGRLTSIFTQENSDRVAQLYRETPKAYSSRVSLQLQLSKMSIRRIIKSLGLKHYFPRLFKF